jgi:hypothetical protein
MAPIQAPIQAPIHAQKLSLATQKGPERPVKTTGMSEIAQYVTFASFVRQFVHLFSPQEWGVTRRIIDW